MQPALPTETSVRAVILAAGVGRRLGSDGDGAPKILLSFGGRTLLERHLHILRDCGITAVTLVVGHEKEQVGAALDGMGASSVERIENPAFREGSVVSLAAAAPVLRAGSTVVLMDADVIYDRRLMGRLLRSPHADCLLLDRGIEPGDEPVKLCIAGGRIVDFAKKPEAAHEWHGESVGFFRFSPGTARELAGRAEAYAGGDRRACEYEEAIRDMIKADPTRFGFEDISSLPWTEIDFAEDVAKARALLPQLAA